MTATALSTTPWSSHRLRGTGFLRLESVEAEKNRFRFYAFTWQQTLWGEWAICCTWGRIGGLGRSRTAYLGDRYGLPDALAELVVHRTRRGYRRDDHDEIEPPGATDARPDEEVSALCAVAWTKRLAARMMVEDAGGRPPDADITVGQPEIIIAPSGAGGVFMAARDGMSQQDKCEGQLNAAAPPTLCNSIRRAEPRADLDIQAGKVQEAVLAALASLGGEWQGNLDAVAVGDTAIVEGPTVSGRGVGPYGLASAGARA